MSRPITTLALALALLVAGAASAGAEFAPRDLTLRLTDFPPGYAVLVPTCSDQAPIADLAPGTGHACEMDFWHVWTASGTGSDPAMVISTVLVLPSAERAATALADPLDVASLALPEFEQPRIVSPAPAIGDEAVLLRGADGSAAVLWRSGPVLAGLLADAALIRHRTIDVQTTLNLATLQQARIAAPTALQPGDNEGGAVPLDDPGLDLPIWWLGRELPGRGALPELRFVGSIPGNLFGDVEDAGPILFYGRRHSRAQVTLALVRPRFMHRPAVRRDLRRMRHSRCYPLRRLTLRGGRATIFQRSPRCRKLDERKTPNALDDTTAVVTLPGVVAIVAADDCVSCHGPVSRYESIAGMRRIVRALRLREPRAVATP